jgi:ribosomal peptide maturation radical SAM protein 1
VSAAVILAVAPFLSVVRPSLGVSLLKSALSYRGIDATVEYPCLEFAEVLGVDSYQWIAEASNVSWLLGEWVFAECLFGGDAVNDAKRQELLDAIDLPSYIRIAVKRARDLAPRFVNDTAIKLIGKNAKILGFSTTFQQNFSSLAIASRVKEISPQTCIVFGGANCEGEMGRTLLSTFPQIDYVFSGESDQTFPVFADAFLRDPHNIVSDGVNVLSRHPAIGTCFETLTEDLDALPRPDFQDYFDQLKSMTFCDRVNPALLIETSRGCWWGMKHHCTFCGLNGVSMKYRSKTAQAVLAEITDQSTKWGISNFQAVDNIMDMSHIEDVFSKLSHERHRFFYEVKSNLSSQQLHALARGGVSWVQPGIESLNDDILKLMKKGVTGATNIRFLRSCEESGVIPLWNFLTGFPGEEAEHYAEMRALIPYVMHLRPPSSCFPIRLDRFSPYFERFKEFGFEEVLPVSSYRMVYPLPDEIIRGLAYFFEGKRPADSRIAEEIAGLSQAVTQWKELYYGENKPILSKITLAGVTIVKDTRPVAPAPTYFLSDAENAALEAFRNPRILDFDAPLLGDPLVASAVSRMVELGYIKKIGRYAVSLIVEFGWRVYADQPNRYPGGTLAVSRLAAGFPEKKSIALIEGD